MSVKGEEPILPTVVNYWNSSAPVIKQNVETHIGPIIVHPALKTRMQIVSSSNDVYDTRFVFSTQQIKKLLKFFAPSRYQSVVN